METITLNKIHEDILSLRKEMNEKGRHLKQWNSNKILLKEQEI